MATARPPCPPGAFAYNSSTLCACGPGLYSSGGACAGLEAGPWEVASGVGPPEPTFLNAVLPLDALQRLTQPQEVFVGTTAAAVLLWVAFCLALRLGRVDGGGSPWFRMRWGISRLDCRYDARHWLEDLKVVTKRKTELGGTFSVASWILFVGLLSALLYQIITKKSIEIHKVRPTNAPDLISFINDMEFNITTISSMSCSHLRGLDTLVIGTPGSIDHKVSPLSTYANYTCYNTSKGPTISLKCSGCEVPRGDHYISWQFVDLPNDPATAVGFQFNLTAKDHGDDKHVSFVSGTLKPASYRSDTPETLRGPDMNILKIHLFPQKFIYLHNLKLIQPLLNDFLPGSSFSETANLQASLQSSKDGLVKTTLYISYLSDYIVEIDKERIFGIVSFLADVGGLYAISFAIFLYFLWQCEARFKKLRTEDNVMRDIRRRRRAQRHWDKLRKYVNYTWGHSNLDMKISSRRHDSLMGGSCYRIGSLHRVKQSRRMDSINFDKRANIPCEMNFVPDASYTGSVKSKADDATEFMEHC